MRLIDADAFIQRLREACEDKATRMIVDKIGVFLETEATFHPVDAEPVKCGKWVSVKEMLPEANGRYLVTRGLVVAGAIWNRVYIANYSDLMGIKSEKIWWQGNVGKSGFERLDDVVSWMLLPKPWKGVEE